MDRDLQQVGRLCLQRILVGDVDNATSVGDGERARAVYAEGDRGMRLAARFGDSGETRRESGDFCARGIRERLLFAGRRRRRHGGRGGPMLRPVECHRDVQLSRGNVTVFAADSLLQGAVEK